MTSTSEDEVSLAMDIPALTVVGLARACNWTDGVVFAMLIGLR